MSQDLPSFDTVQLASSHIPASRWPGADGLTVADAHSSLTDYRRTFKAADGVIPPVSDRGNKTMVVRVALALVLAFVSLGIRAEGVGIHRHVYLGKVPPELVGEKSHWLGTGQPVSLADLKGRVVWLQFNF